VTVAALRDELEREDVLWGLTMMRRAESWERWEIAEAMVRKHLPPGVYVRMPWPLMPDWYRNLWWDPTQVDGRAEVQEIDQTTVRLAGVGPNGSQTVYHLRTTEFLDAVLSGFIGDSS
jgi:hypothetical protein